MKFSGICRCFCSKSETNASPGPAQSGKSSRAYGRAWWGGIAGLARPRDRRAGRPARAFRDEHEGGDHAGLLRSEVNNSLIIVNFFHKIQNFRQISDLFSQISLKKRHTSLFSGIWREIRKKIHQKFAEKIQNSKCLRLN